MSHRPRKRFGQNFLHDPGVIRRIVAAVSPESGQRMVEIGPGQGAITTALLEATGALDVIELDRDLVAVLRDRFADVEGFRVHEADALKFDLATLAAPAGKLRLVGNLPYNISTPILFRCLEQLELVEDMHFMLQKEVVDRMAATPGGRDYGRLSVMVQFDCHVEPLFDIGPGAFSPPPKVQSTVVRLIPHAASPWPDTDRKLFADVVARAFAQRRKTLRNALRDLAAAEVIEAAGIDPGARAETLGIAEFVRLAGVTEVGLRD